MGAHAESTYAAPDQIQNSLPNTVWLEAGVDFGLTKNVLPSVFHSGTKTHLVNQLEAAGVTWKAYVEGVTAGQCPIVDNYPYATFNVPFLFFDDVVGNPPSPASKRCIEHVAPFSQLAADLAAQAAPRYAFVVPDECDDMHDNCSTGDPVKQGDDWLKANIPGILSSKAYADGGVVFIAWDYSNTGYDPIGFIAISPKAHPGFASKTKHTTSSTLRSLQEIFGVSPFIGDAANANDVSEMFTSFP
jgi:phospholipase C